MSEITAEKIIQNCLDCYDLNSVQDKKLQKELSLNILKDLQDAGFIKSVNISDVHINTKLNYTRFYIDGYDIEDNILYAYIITECNLRLEQPLLEEVVNGDAFIQYYKQLSFYSLEKYSTIKEFEKLVNNDTNIDFITLIAKYIEYTNGSICYKTVEEIEFPEGREPDMKPRLLGIGSIVDTAYGIGKVLPVVKMFYWEVDIFEPKRRFKKGVYRLSDAKLHKVIQNVN
jgi:ribosomal protein S8